jgi:hypothetical protein
VLWLRVTLRRLWLGASEPAFALGVSLPIGSHDV